MGLSGRKVKQRIPQDPRNLSWADDAARFGSNYLSKFGWDSSKGLGVEGEGRTSHIKVSHKLDMLGIGAAHQRDPDGVAWKQNTEFENLLKRLNDSAAQETHVDKEKEDCDCTDDESEKKKKKKRKHKEGEDGGEREKKKNRKEKESANAEQPATVEIMQVEELVEGKTASVEVKKTAVSLPRHRSHRARAIAAKNMSSKSAAHISEILGIAPTPSALYSGTDAHQGRLTSLTDTDGLETEKITTSTKSVADYFKEKLLARSSKSATPSSSASISDDNDAYEAPRMGLGSRLRVEVHSETKIEEETQQVGLAKFSSLMSASFLASTSTFSAFSTAFVTPSLYKEEQDEEQGIVHVSDVESEPPVDEKKNKKRKRSKENKEVEAASDDQGKEKKSKKDKKGKRKAEAEAEQDSVTDEAERKKRKREKKENKRKNGVRESEKEEIVDEQDPQNSEGASVSPKEKKKHRTFSNAHPRKLDLDAS